MRPTKFGQPLAKPRSFRLPAADDAKLAAKLAETGMEMSEFLRDYVLRERTEVIPRPSKPSFQAQAERQRLIGLVGKAGNNVNQIAHRVNLEYRSGIISEATYGAVLGELEAIALYFRACLPLC